MSTTAVKKGDKLSKNDPIIVLESEKAAMEVPSDFIFNISTRACSQSNYKRSRIELLAFVV